jgi:hypothetical protein
MTSKLKLGINEGISNAEYHADKTFLSSTPLKTLYKDPAQFYREYMLGEKKQMSGDHLDEGTAIHTALLEPHLFDSEIACFPGMRKSGADWEAFLEANSEKIILNAGQKSRTDAAVRAAEARPELKEFLSGGQPELSLCCELLGVPVKARPDYINADKGYIVDIKTTRHPADMEMFKHTIQEYSYQLSAALYCQIAYEQYRKLFDFFFAVYSKPDRQWDIYKTSSATLTDGHAMVNKALVAFKKCKESGIWTIDSVGQKNIQLNGSNYEIVEV